MSSPSLPKVSVVIVSYNSRRELPWCLDAVLGQTHWNHEIILVDNASTDGSAAYVTDHYDMVRVVEMHENIGYAAANNMGIRLSQGDFVLTLNPDVFLAPDHLEKLLPVFLHKESRVGGVQGKLYQAKIGEADIEKSDRLDSTGDIILRDRHAISRGQGEVDQGQYDDARWTFGLTGAAALWSRPMLEEVAIDNHYFDETFFAYKEDIDLSWRSRMLGWEFEFVPTAVGWHGRGWGSADKPVRGGIARIRRLLFNRRSVSPLLQYHSVKNRHLMILQNDFTFNILRHALWIIAFEFGIVLTALLRERGTLRAFADIWTLRKHWQSMRRQIMQRRQVTAGQASSWFGRER